MSVMSIAARGPSAHLVQTAYDQARERYAALRVDTERALAALQGISLSLHCWQGDDVGGFENAGAALGGGIAATGNYPGKARTADELRARPRQGLQPDPRHGTALNLHAIYARDRRQQGRAQRAPARALHGLDRLGQGQRTRARFQPDLFSHPLAADGFTLSHRDARHPPVLDRALHRLPADRGMLRRGSWARLRDQHLDPRRLQGHARRPQGARASASPNRSTRSSPSRSTRSTTSTPSRASCSASARESYIVGSHEFYLGYAITRKECCCAWMPATSTPPRRIADKISSVLLYVPERAAARQPRRALGQRPRRHAHRRTAGHRSGSRPRRLPRTACTSGWITSTRASTASPPGSSARATSCGLRSWRCSSPSSSCARWKIRRLQQPTGTARRRAKGACLGGGLGLFLFTTGGPCRSTFPGRSTTLRGASSFREGKDQP